MGTYHKSQYRLLLNVKLSFEGSRGSSFSLLTRIRAERPGFDSRRGWGTDFFFFVTVSRPTLRPNQPPIQRAQGALSPLVKRLRREANHSPPSSAERVELPFHPPIHLQGVVHSW